MPTGKLLVAERAITFAGTIHPAPRTILDVGPGFGKYGVLLREYLDPTPMLIDAVEMWRPYVEAHRLRGIYNDVHVGDALDLAESTLAGYDLVNMGDVIEHMDKGRALDFIDRVRGWLVIATPVEHFHTGEGLPPTEAHISHWTVEDFEAIGRLDRYEESHGAHIARLGPR